MAPSVGFGHLTRVPVLEIKTFNMWTLSRTIVSAGFNMSVRSTILSPACRATSYRLVKKTMIITTARKWQGVSLASVLAVIFPFSTIVANSVEKVWVHLMLV